MRRFLISKAIGGDKLWTPRGDIRYGQAHYSWMLIARLYEQALAALSYPTQEMVRPEIYQSPLAGATLHLSLSDIHLAIKPIEELRRLKFTRNFFVCGWEFPEFSTTPFESNPFFNQIQTLGGADAVLCWSDFTRTNLERHGLTNAFTLPPPLAGASDMEDGVPAVDCLTLDTHCAPGSEAPVALPTFLAAHQHSRRFVSVLNPWDRRKELPRMMSEFVQAARETPDICLVVKLVIDNQGTTVLNVNEILRAVYGLELKADNVAFVGAALSDIDLRRVLKQAHYYLCTSSAEGLNLPLIEAMIQGVVPLAPWNSAMGTYLDASCSIGMETERRDHQGRTHALHDHLSTSIFPPRSGAVQSAVTRAVRLPQREDQQLRRQARSRARERFGLATFSDRLERILQWRA